jgi:fructokinase
VRGAWCYDGVNLFHGEALLRESVDSTGAGDAFISGFFAAHLKGLGIMTSLKWGIANSSNSVTQYGGQKGLLDEKQMKEMISKIIVNKEDK